MPEQPIAQAGSTPRMKVQKFRWGALQWVSESTLTGEGRAMLVARASFRPGGIQHAHYHLDEQVLYVERGRAICEVNGRSLEIGPGDLFHAPPFCWHSVHNREDTDLVLLVTYREVDPFVTLNLEHVKGGTLPPLPTHTYLETTLARLSDSLLTLEDVHSLLKTIGAEMLVVDPSGLVDHPERLPAFCRLVRSTPDGLRMCRTRLAQFSKGHMPGCKVVDNDTCYQAHAGVCCAGVTFVAVPLGPPGVRAGTVLVTGITLVSPDEPAVLRKLSSLESRLGFPHGHLVAPYSAVPQVSKNNLYAIMRLLLGVVKDGTEKPKGACINRSMQRNIERQGVSHQPSADPGQTGPGSAQIVEGSWAHIARQVFALDSLHATELPDRPGSAQSPSRALTGLPSLRSTTNRSLEEACEYVRARCNRPLRLGEVARHVFMNPCYLSRKFKQSLGISFSQYLHLVRIERAVARLQAEPGVSLKDLAFSLGFSSPSHFTRVFKRITGLTPTQYRTQRPC